MQPVLHGDVVAAARVLVGVAPRRRSWVLLRLRREAEVADLHRRAMGCGHPRYGDGSVEAAALRRKPGPEPRLTSEAYRRSLTQVLDEIYPDAQETQRTAVGSSARRAGAMSSPQSSQ